MALQKTNPIRCPSSIRPGFSHPHLLSAHCCRFVQVLEMQRKALAHLTKVVRKDQADSELVAHALSESLTLSGGGVAGMVGAKARTDAEMRR